MRSEKICLELNREEALVLFEWLAGLEKRQGIFDDPSEESGTGLEFAGIIGREDAVRL